MARRKTGLSMKKNKISNYCGRNKSRNKIVEIWKFYLAHSV